MSHYIWNRAERVEKSLMPHRLTECFERWLREQKTRLNLTTKAKSRKAIIATIKRQRTNYENALRIHQNKHTSICNSVNA